MAPGVEFFVFEPSPMKLLSVEFRLGNVSGVEFWICYFNRESAFCELDGGFCVKWASNEHGGLRGNGEKADR